MKIKTIWPRKGTQPSSRPQFPTHILQCSLKFPHISSIKNLFQIYKDYSALFQISRAIRPSVSDLQGLFVLCFRFARLFVLCFRFTRAIRPLFQIIQGLFVLCFRFTRAIRPLFPDLQGLFVLCFRFTRAIRPLFQIYKAIRPPGFRFTRAIHLCFRFTKAIHLVSDLQGLFVLCFRFARAIRPLFQIYKGYSSPVSDLQGLFVPLFQIYKSYSSSVSDLQGLFVLCFRFTRGCSSSVSDLQGLFDLCFRFTRAIRPLFQIYKGYSDDPRNTDNAWIETRAVNFHDEDGHILNNFKIRVSTVSEGSGNTLQRCVFVLWVVCSLFCTL